MAADGDAKGAVAEMVSPAAVERAEQKNRKRGRPDCEGGETENKGQGMSKRIQKQNFIYGNYRHYYGYRLDRNGKEDPRLSIFRKEWFEGKDCLDIGCNEGLVTISIAEKFQCRTIHGVDIDQSLVDNAYWNLRRMQRSKRSGKKYSNCNLPDAKASSESMNENSNGESLNSETDGPNDAEIDLSKVVSFHCENFVESICQISQDYDTIICLSVTKWVHLNWGDDGLINLFVKIWGMLRPGGVLILEPQPWSSYRKNRNSEDARRNYSSIFLFPDKFQEILLDKVGFQSCEVVANKLSGAVAGFDRPIMAFYK